MLVPMHVHASPPMVIVKSGDVLSVLAERFEVSVEEIQEWNGLESDHIEVGQKLIVGIDPATNEPEDTEGVDKPYTGPTYTIVRGDTLSHVARRVGMEYDALLKANPGINADKLRVGQVIRVSGDDRHRIDYKVRRGEILARIAQRHRVSVRDLQRWNPRLKPNRLRAGQVLRIISEIPASTSESIGKPNKGKLLHPERLPPHPGYQIRNRSRAYGTLETVTWLLDAFDAVREKHPRAKKARVHDISDRNGGTLHGHKSHQSGRDVDISFYQKRCPSGVCMMRRITPEQLDVPKQYTLFRQWLVNKQVDAIFIDYSLQKPLYQYARRQGATSEQLHRWFQYPRGKGYPLGIVRHYPRHRDHAHVRFTCPDTDEECKR